MSSFGFSEQMGLGSACHKPTWPQVQLGGDYSPGSRPDFQRGHWAEEGRKSPQGIVGKGKSPLASEDARPKQGSRMGQARKMVILAPCHPTGFCSLWSWGMKAIFADLALGEGRKNSHIWVPHTCTCKGLCHVQGTFRDMISLQASWGNKQSGLSCSRAERVSCKHIL